MQVNSIMSFNTNSNNLNQINFKKAIMDKSVEAFIEQQVQNGVAFVKSQKRKKMTKKQIKACETNMRAGWYQAYRALEKKASQMNDGIEITVSKTERNIFDMLLAKNPKNGESADLVALVELKGVESYNIGKDKFQRLVENIDPKRINEKLDPNARRSHLGNYWA